MSGEYDIDEEEGEIGFSKSPTALLSERIGSLEYILGVKREQLDEELEQIKLSEGKISKLEADVATITESIKWYERTLRDLCDK